MSLQKLMSNYAEYNQWANEKTVQWLSEKPEADFYREMPSSYPSIVLSINHILAVEEFWYAVITKSIPVSMRYMVTDPEHTDVFEHLPKQSASLTTFISSLNEADLLEEIYLETPWIQGTLPRYEFIQHLFNHSTYHRGQVVTIGRQLGYTDAPMTDYNFFNMAVLNRESVV
ncbi:MAG TPA: DinB family protein [Saprospiraceae bacterium]|nr:DinB family protein [Saprospiraceae bacterium]